MTPLVRHFFRIVPFDAQAHWFDLGAMPAEAVGMVLDDAAQQRITHLPFSVCHLVFLDADGDRSFLRLQQGDSRHLIVSGLAEQGSRLVTIDPWVILVLDDGVQIVDRDAQSALQPMQGWRAQAGRAALLIVDTFLRNLASAPTSAFSAEPKPGSFLNAKRARKGLGPATLIWRTVEITQRDGQPETIGAYTPTGRTLRMHDRRGHWRRLSPDRVVWVRPCRIGNPQAGVSLHDYRVRLRDPSGESRSP
jgi:hypothetical protein